jgi:hypothetical protein
MKYKYKKVEYYMLGVLVYKKFIWHYSFENEKRLAVSYKADPKRLSNITSIVSNIMTILVRVVQLIPLGITLFFT